MAVFKPDQPIETEKPVVEVENKLEPGTYRFELIVIDDEGNKSAPALALVNVIKPG